ncbi:MAG: hypothetical protein CO137_03070 [Candidatus Magasanikbacteria bacterium CG_4_9_14_3_um_filter_32_9]|uniref:Uncharacterized protein n=1 Tax=Candidatus Magasanikbacteria bacterium CG_4_9_14_3_um_filter_32_9 TaxID=1974644 RepID=A0A2M7Z686_9BACT|nr:MAG: hypothetical protein CO137_03070 [Candidatus Magasanikbacteria bacterium CG_4_9_14_3_um_filter_32_9]
MPKNEALSFTLSCQNYTTIYNQVIDLSDLTNEERKFLGQVFTKFIFEKSYWPAFGAFWLRLGKKTVWKEKEVEEVTRSKAFAICQDLEGRLGIQQGFIPSENFYFDPTKDFANCKKKCGDCCICRGVSCEHTVKVPKK